MSHRKKLFIAIAVVMLVLMGIWLATGFVSPMDDVEAYKKSLIDRGEKLEVAQVTPLPVPMEQNGVDVLDQALKMFVLINNPYQSLPAAMRGVAPGSAMVSFEQPEIRNFNFTNSWSSVAGIERDDCRAIEELEQITNYPAVDFRVDYTKQPGMALPFLGSLWFVGQRVTGEAIYDLHEGDAASATTKINALLVLADDERDARLPIYEQMRMSQVIAGAGATWELLQSTNVTDRDLATLQNDWERLEFIHAAENEFLMRRALSEAEMTKLRTSNDFFLQVYGRRSAPRMVSKDLLQYLRQEVVMALWRNVWVYDDEMRMLQGDQIALDAFRTAETNGVFYPSYTNMIGQLGLLATNRPHYFLERLDSIGVHRFYGLPGGMSLTFEDTMRLEAAREMVVAAIALRRYEIKYGKYPPELASLVPEFVSKVPVDPMDGKALRYRLDAGGNFLLYSIGENGVDDRGNPSQRIIHRGMDLNWLGINAMDWVWPQPASAAEIEHYLPHP